MTAVPRCSRCHRALKDPVSISLGIGPECRGRSHNGKGARPRSNPRETQISLETIGEPLAAPEMDRLSHCEAVIEKGLYTFVEVGFALLEIRDGRLYRQGYGTFEDYCRERWGLKQSRAYQFLDAARVVDNLKSSTIVELLPGNEAQTRPLAALPPDEQVRVWQEVVDTAPHGKITAAHVRDVVDRSNGQERLVTAMSHASRASAEAPLEKFLRTHRNGCAVHIYSGDRRCSCGRDEALTEVRRLQDIERTYQALIKEAS